MISTSCFSSKSLPDLTPLQLPEAAQSVSGLIILTRGMPADPVLSKLEHHHTLKAQMNMHHELQVYLVQNSSTPSTRGFLPVLSWCPRANAVFFVCRDCSQPSSTPSAGPTPLPSLPPPTVKASSLWPPEIPPCVQQA